MKKLEEYRMEINDIDREIANLFYKRMMAVKNVALYKKDHGLKVFDQEREESVIANNSKYIDDIELRSYYVSFIKNIMDLSKQYQNRLLDGMRVAYSGVEGAFAHIAAKKIFSNSQYLPYNNFNLAYESVVNGECDCCVLPIENSFAGEVTQVTDLIFSGSLYISGVYYLEISHNLLGLESSQISDIKTVISHPQALSQCEGYIRSYNFEQIKEKNTAISAQTVATSNDKSIAAIASSETAKLYGLKVLDHDINESSGNTTRFAVFSRSQNISNVSDSRFIMLFTVGNEAGALAKAINVISEHGFNMRVLRSRPIKEESWQYYFYVEAEGNPYDENGVNMLKELSKQCAKVKVAGSFLSEDKL